MPTCATGSHSDVKQDDKDEFFKSSTVTNADNALKKHEQGVVIKDINAYNKGMISNIQIWKTRRRKKLSQPAQWRKSYLSPRRET